MLKHLSGGLQNFLLRYRLLRQAGGMLILWFFLIFIILNGAWAYFKTNSYDYYVLYKLIQAKFQIFLSTLYLYVGSSDLAHTTLEMSYVSGDGTSSTVRADKLLQDNGTLQFILHLKSTFYKGIIGGFILSLYSIFMVSFFLKDRGKKASEEKHIRGSSIVSANDVADLIVKKGESSHLKIAGVPLPKDSETQHILIIGAPGSGKTVCMSEILQQVRERNHRAIVYDKMGTYTRRFFRPGKDILLNPLDKRCPPWNVWGECEMPEHYESIAESLMPMPTKGQDPFWIMAARIMFAVAARKLGYQGEKSTMRLLRFLLMADLNRIQELLKNTEAESLASDKVEKLAISVKAVLTTYLKSLRYLQDSESPFSIRKWIADEKNDNWIFITSRGDQHATLKPLISTWLDISSNAMMSLSANRERRIFIACDETDSLQYMPSIVELATQGRQFGGCGIFSVQAISQFFKNFGEHDAETLISCCNTGIYFRSRGKITAPYVSDLIDEAEIEEKNENISYGPAGTKESVSIQPIRHTKKVVLPSQIKKLDDLEAYLQLRGNLPITKVKFDYKVYPETQSSFDRKDINLDKELEEAMQRINTEWKTLQASETRETNETTENRSHLSDEYLAQSKVKKSKSERKVFD